MARPHASPSPTPSNAHGRDVLGTVSAFLDAFAGRDVESAVLHLTPDVHVVGSGAMERASSLEGVRAGLEMERESRTAPASYEVTGSAVREGGDAAWAETDLLFTIHTEPVPYFLPPLRWTWFLRREGGGPWLIEHYHCSVAWRGDEGEYESVPRSEMDEQRRALEALIEERTAELTANNAELERTVGELHAAQDQLRAVTELWTRKSVADDLHDELGSRAGAIGLQLEVASRSLPVSDPARERLREAAEVTRRLASDVREVVWLVDPGHDTASALVERMAASAREVLRGVPHAVRTEGDPTAGAPLPLEFRRHVLLALREAAHNALRHAEPAHVDVVLQAGASAVSFEVADDGRGFDAEGDPAPDGAREGRGLRSMRERAGAVGGTLEVVTAPGRGTRVRFEAPFPCPVGGDA